MTYGPECQAKIKREIDQPDQRDWRKYRGDKRARRGDNGYGWW